MAAYYFMANRFEGGAAVGGKVTWYTDSGDEMFSQRPTKVVPKSLIEATFEPNFFGPGAKSSRMAFTIEPEGAVCKLTIELFDIPPGQDGVAEGWARFAASLKSWLGTGTPLRSAM